MKGEEHRRCARKQDYRELDALIDELQQADEKRRSELPTQGPEGQGRQGESLGAKEAEERQSRGKKGGIGPVVVEEEQKEVLQWRKEKKVGAS